MSSEKSDTKLTGKFRKLLHASKEKISVDFKERKADKLKGVLSLIMDKAKGTDDHVTDDHSITPMAPTSLDKTLNNIFSLGDSSVFLSLIGGRYHTTKITIRYQSEKPLSDTTIFYWYRFLPNGSFLSLKGVRVGYYQPSIDDVGAIICCQSIHSGCTPSHFAEIGPLEMDPGVERVVTEYLVDSEQNFTLTESSNHQPATLFVSREQLRLASSNDIKTINISSDIKVLLSTNSPVHFTIKNSKMQSFSAYTNISRTRDEICLLIRRIIESFQDKDNLDEQQFVEQNQNLKYRSILLRAQQTIETQKHYQQMLISKIQAITQENEQLSDKYKTLYETNTLLQENISELEGLPVKIQKQNEQIKAMVEDKQHDSDQIVSLQSSLQEVTSQENTNEIDLMKQKNQELTSQLNAKEEVNKNLSEKLCQIQNGDDIDLSAQIHTQLNEIQSFKQEISDLKELLQIHEKDLKKKKDEFDLKEAEILRLGGIREVLEEEKNSLERELKEYKNKITEIEDKYNKNISEINSTKEDKILHYKQQLENKTSELEQYIIDYSALKLEHTSCKHIVETANKNLRKANIEKDEAMKKSQKYEEELVPQVDSNREKLNEILAERNFFKRKAKSLQDEYHKHIESCSNSNLNSPIKKDNTLEAPTPKNSHSRTKMNSQNTNTPLNASLHEEKTQSHQKQNKNINFSISSDSPIVDDKGMKKRLEFDIDESSDSSVIEKLRKENKELQQVVFAYQKTLNEQLQRQKGSKKTTQELSKRLGIVKERSSSVKKKFLDLTQTTNELSEDVIDKDVALDHMRIALKILGSKVTEYETEIERLTKKENVNS